MPRPSSIDRLPEEIRAEIGRLRMRGCTIDAILTTLRGMTPDAPSRSALGRHMLRMDALGEKMRRSRQVAEALVETLGDAPESQAAKLNIELLHSTVMDLFMDAADGETDDLDDGAKAALAGNPMGVMMLAKAVESLTKASRSNQDFIVSAEKRATERAKKEAAATVAAVGAARGLSADTIKAIQSNIFGVQA